MKKVAFILLTILSSCANVALCQTYNAAYVKALYAKYPAKKSNFCPACKIWVNPYFKSIADTVRHMPLITYEYYTHANQLIADKLNIPRQKPKKIIAGDMPYNSEFSQWHPIPGQQDEGALYAAANVILKKSSDEENIGHCQAWVLNSFAIDAVIFTDTYTFNAAIEDKWQNIGTELKSEEITRKDLETADEQVWCGTYGSQGSFTNKGVTDNYPSFYWKVTIFKGVTTCYWMPNKKDQSQDKLPGCIVSYQQLIKNIGFDPEKTLN